MQLTHHGHACVLLEDPGGSRLLIDPGNLSADAGTVGPVDAVLVTHQHPDHVDPAQLRTIRASSPDAHVHADEATAAQLSTDGFDHVRPIGANGTMVDLDAAGIPVRATTVTHEVMHVEIPTPPNNAYLVADRILHPGDAFWVPEQDVDVLLLPIGAPWLRIGDVIDYLREVSPRVAIPIHQGGLAEPHRRLHCDLLRKLGPSETTLQVVDEGQPVQV